MGEYHHWIFYRDQSGYTKRRMKDLNAHPITMELAQDAAFVALAKAWAWQRAGPTSAVNAGGWPPGTNPRDAIADYWYAVIQRWRWHAPDEFGDEPDTLSGWVTKIKSLAEQKPLLDFN